MNEKKREIVKWSVLVGAFLVLVLPYCYSMLYSVPTADDFSMIVNGDPENGFWADFLFAIKTANRRYMRQGGSWLCFFLQLLFNPILQFGYKGITYGISNLINMTISFLGLGTALNLIYKHLCKVEERFYRFVLVFFSFALMLLSDTYIEVFNWFVGASYLWWLVFEFLAIALMIMYFKNRERKVTIALVIIGGIGCMGIPYCIPIGLPYLVIYLQDCLQKRKFDKKPLWIFVWFVCCGLSNVLAPGNTVRNEALGGDGLDYFGAVYYALIDCKMILKRMLKNPYIWLILGLFLIFGILYNQKKKKEVKNPFLYYIIGIILVFGKIYPVALGYGYYGTPNRVVFMVAVFALIYYSILLFWLGEYLAYQYQIAFQKKDILLIGFMVIIYGYCAIILAGNVSNMTWLKNIREREAIKKEHDYYISLLTDIDNSEESNIIITDPIYPYTELIKPLYFRDDKSYWINIGVARYFDKESVIWVEEEQ